MLFAFLGFSPFVGNLVGWAMPTKPGNGLVGIAHPTI